MRSMRKLLALAFVVPMFSFAQTGQKSEKAKTQTLIFEGDDVLGAREVPSDEVITVRCTKHVDSLIKVRTDFNDKLLSSVHEM